MQRVRHGLHFEGHTVSVFDTPDSQTVRFLLNDLTERNHLRTMPDNPKLILDIGAHVGIFSFLCAKLLPECQVIAVEPHAINATNFAIGAIANKLKNVQLIPCAIGDGSPVILSAEFANTGSSAAYEKNFRKFPKEWPRLVHKAPSITLNELFERVAVNPGRYVDFLKCDIEGGEFYIFEDFKYWKYVKAMTIELHPFHKADSKQEAIELSKQLSRFLVEKMEGRVEIINPDFRELDNVAPGQ